MTSRLDLRMRRGELLSAAAAVLLLVLMFATEWFGIDDLPSRSQAGAGRATAEDAWNGLADIRWVLLLTVLVAVGSAVLHASQRSHGTTTNTGLLITIFGCASSVALVYRVLIDLPSQQRVVDQKLGAVLAVFCAIAIAIGGSEALRVERSRAREAEQQSRREKPVAAQGLTR